MKNNYFLRSSNEYGLFQDGDKIYLVKHIKEYKQEDLHLAINDLIDMMNVTKDNEEDDINEKQY